MRRACEEVAQAFLICSLVGALLPVPALAEEEGTQQIGVILFSAQGVDPARSSRLGDALRRTMRLAGKAGIAIPDVADLDRKNDGMLVAEGEQHLIDAQRYFLRGLNLLKQDRRAEAFEEFERALHFYRNAYPYAQDDRLYTDISFYIAEMAQSMKGSSKRVKDFFRCEAIGLTVELAGAPDELDKVNRVFPECEWKIDDAEARTLDVTSNPPGARVYVDGQYRGVTPLHLTNLRAGEHVFTFVREGFRRVSRLIKVGEKFAETRELEMGLHLKPGVYQRVYKELIPVVQGAAGGQERTILLKAAETLEVAGLLMVLTVPTTGGGIKIYSTEWAGKEKPVVRKEFDVDLSTPDKIEEAVVTILSGVYSVGASDLPSLAERPPIFFKLGIPPFVPEEEY